MNPVRSVGQALPFPRDLAAAALWHDLLALCHGRPPGGMSVERARLQRDLGRCRDLLRRDRADAAIEAADALLSAAPGSGPVLRLKLDAEQAAGRSHDALRTIRSLRRVEDTGRLAALERRLAGSILVDETDWIPDLPTGEWRRDPDGPSLVLIPKDCLDPGGRRWTEAILAALVDAELRPVVIPDPGVPHDLLDGLATVRAGSVTWVPIDLGQSYPTDPPADRMVLDVAWAAAAVARTIRPARIVALVTRDQGGLLAGLSIQDAAACPVVAVVGTLEAAGDWPGTSARRLDRAERVIAAPDPEDPRLVEALREVGRNGLRPVGA